MVVKDLWVLDQVQGVKWYHVQKVAGPGPGGVWPRCDCVLALVWPIFGRGATVCGGPSPLSVALGYLWGMVAGPGPGGKMAPRPKSGWTRSTKALDLVQGECGVGIEVTVQA